LQRFLLNLLFDSCYLSFTNRNAGIARFLQRIPQKKASAAVSRKFLNIARKRLLNRSAAQTKTSLFYVFGNVTLSIIPFLAIL
jgi:hypothetical protein